MAAPVSDQALDEWLALAAFEGESDAALIVLHGFFSRRFAASALALCLARDLPIGQVRLAGLVDAQGRELVPASDPFGERLRLPMFDDALSRAAFTSLVPKRVDVDDTLLATPLARALGDPASLLAFPVIMQGRVEHWLVIASRDRDFAAVDLRHAQLEAALAYALLSQSIAVRTLTAENTRTHRQIEDLADVQRLLQPDGAAIRGLEYAIHWQPAETAAGDYYDAMSLTHIVRDFEDRGSDAWGVILADVSGHGAAAAMEAVQFDAILRTYRGDEPPGGPGGALTYANRHFFSRKQRRHFMTAFSVAGRPDLDAMSYVCAGHLPALLRTRDGMKWLGRDGDAGIPLGILREHRWDNVEHAFHVGDLLVLYTDGIIEARDEHGTMFGEQRLAEAVRAAADGGSEEVLRAIVDALRAHQGGDVGDDDQTVIVLRRTR